MARKKQMVELEGLYRTELEFLIKELTVGNSVTLPIEATIRRPCGCCESVNNVTFVLTEGASTVNNIAVRIEKS